jgi:hypothetical protein
MLRSTANVPAGTLLNTFSGTTGSAVPVTIGTQFATKAYVDSAIQGVPEPDLTPFVQKAGDTMTGALILSGDPTLPLGAVPKQYLEQEIGAIDTLTGDTLTLESDFLTIKNKAGDETQFEINPSVGAFSVPVIYTDNLFRPTQDAMLVNKVYVDEEIKDAVDAIPEPDLTPFLKKDGTVAMTGALDMGTNKLINLTTGVNPTESVNKGYVDGEDAVLQG